MANPYRGEVTLTFAGRAYTLRPTFHILATIEHRLGLSLPRLLRRIEVKGLLTSELLMILSIATQHDGSAPFEPEAALDLPIEQVALERVMHAVSQFLLQAMGGEPALHLPRLMENSFRVLGLNPTTFWQLTMAELRPLMSETPALPSAEAIQELSVLMNRFPDPSVVA